MMKSKTFYIISILFYFNKCTATDKIDCVCMNKNVLQQLFHSIHIECYHLSLMTPTPGLNKRNLYIDLGSSQASFHNTFA